VRSGFISRPRQTLLEGKINSKRKKQIEKEKEKGLRGKVVPREDADYDEMDGRSGKKISGKKNPGKKPGGRGNWKKRQTMLGAGSSLLCRSNGKNNFRGEVHEKKR